MSAPPPWRRAAERPKPSYQTTKAAPIWNIVESSPLAQLEQSKSSTTSFSASPEKSLSSTLKSSPDGDATHHPLTNSAVTVKHKSTGSAKKSSLTPSSATLALEKSLTPEQFNSRQMLIGKALAILHKLEPKPVKQLCTLVALTIRHPHAFGDENARKALKALNLFLNYAKSIGVLNTLDYSSIYPAEIIDGRALGSFKKQHFSSVKHLNDTGESRKSVSQSAIGGNNTNTSSLVGAASFTSRDIHPATNVAMSNNHVFGTSAEEAAKSFLRNPYPTIGVVPFGNISVQDSAVRSTKAPTHSAYITNDVKTSNNAPMRSFVAGTAKASKRTLDNRVVGKTNSGEIDGSLSDLYDDFKKEQRAKRFASESAHTSESSLFHDDRTQESVRLGEPIQGRNESILKDYLRLTSEADPSAVRPQRVLEITLKTLEDEWNANHNYAFICNQFKSVRQDLTVQHIQNGFTVQVYEAHARIALSVNDLGEFNQCQSKLKELYEIGVPGSVAEFISYRILYYVYTGNSADLLDELEAISGTPYETDKGVQTAIQLRRAFVTNNFQHFFLLYSESSPLCKILIDSFKQKAEVAALCILAKAIRTGPIPLEFLEDTLNQSSKQLTELFRKLGIEKFVVNNCLVTREAAGLLRDALDRLKSQKTDIKGQI